MQHALQTPASPKRCARIEQNLQRCRSFRFRVAVYRVEWKTCIVAANNYQSESRSDQRLRPTDSHWRFRPKTPVASPEQLSSKYRLPSIPNLYWDHALLASAETVLCFADTMQRKGGRTETDRVLKPVQCIWRVECNDSKRKLQPEFLGWKL